MTHSSQAAPLVEAEVAECSNATACDAAADGPKASPAWDRYWSSGVLHSCATSYRENYAGAVGQSWLDALAPLPPGARVLDIATGNGALPKLALDHLADLALEFDAIDLAMLQPAWWQGLPEDKQRHVRFHCGVAAESMPFSTEAFDMVTSQFGIEYANPALSLPESARVLKLGGQWVGVIHHADSIIVRNAHEELGHGAWLSQPEGLLAVVESLAPLFQRARTAEGRAQLDADALANTLRDRFNDLQDELDRRAAISSCPDLLLEGRRLSGDVLSSAGQGDLPAGLGRLTLFRQAWADSAERLSRLVRCALDEPQLSDWQRRLGSLGVTAEARHLHEGPHLMGWLLRGVKAKRL